MTNVTTFLLKNLIAVFITFLGIIFGIAGFGLTMYGIVARKEEDLSERREGILRNAQHEIPFMNGRLWVHNLIKLMFPQLLTKIRN